MSFIFYEYLLSRLQTSPAQPVERPSQGYSTSEHMRLLATAKVQRHSPAHTVIKSATLLTDASTTLRLSTRNRLPVQIVHYGFQLRTS